MVHAGLPVSVWPSHLELRCRNPEDVRRSNNRGSGGNGSADADGLAAAYAECLQRALEPRATQKDYAPEVSIKIQWLYIGKARKRRKGIVADDRTGQLRTLGIHLSPDRCHRRYVRHTINSLHSNEWLLATERSSLYVMTSVISPATAVFIGSAETRRCHYAFQTSKTISRISLSSGETCKRKGSWIDQWRIPAH